MVWFKIYVLSFFCQRVFQIFLCDHWLKFSGLADPYVKGQLGPYRFRTKTQRKTLSPKWHEEFKIPICTWDSPNVLIIEVRDKDHFVDDTLGYFSKPCYNMVYLRANLCTWCYQKGNVVLFFFWLFVIVYIVVFIYLLIAFFSPSIRRLNNWIKHL